MNEDTLRYPVGSYTPNKTPTAEKLAQWIATIETFPASLSTVVGDLTTEQKQWHYRPGGWSIKQVVHHCVDSHMNALIRFKLALTEDTPTIRPYFEDRWAKLTDAQHDDLRNSLLVLTGLHAKWVALLRSLSPEQLARELIHPDRSGPINLGEFIGNYAWHCDHHLAHVKLAIKAAGKHN